MSDPHADHVILYVAQYIFATSTRRGLGCAASSAQCLVVLPSVPSPTPAPTLTSIIPATGFAPMRMTRLTSQPAEKLYSASEIRLEIPTLNVNIPIVGIPLVDGNWDVTWLGDKAGYLEGTAFPTRPGNSAIAGHVYNSDGEPGPFIGLVQLRYGAEIYLHAWGEKYIYQVRENRLTTPNDQSVFKHEEYSWITLLTCQGYNQANNTYKWRRAVRAVLVKIVAGP
jgi:LPXTG-site transpeptidase (sortase) family protein